MFDIQPISVRGQLPGEGIKYLRAQRKRRAPAWSNEVALRSVELLMEYEPSAYWERISPTPMLIVVALDHLTPGRWR